MKLTVELVPHSCFFSNLRSNLSKRDWEKLRQACFYQAGYRCEICHSDGHGHSLECHEFWQYDDNAHVQTLIGIVALCKACHRVKHMALARKMGWDGQAEDHLATINNWDRMQTVAYLEEVFEVFEERGNHSWSLDISWLYNKGVEIPAILDRDC